MAPAKVQAVDADARFDAEGVQAFVADAGVEAAGVDYTVVAIMGPQSSGKSTLLNHVFGTRFEEMDALSGRHQTTRGVWLSRAPALPAPPALVMDLEGSDGRERGEDDASFERKAALFALASADAVIVNMWAKDVGREAGSGKPLLKTIFQVNLRLFAPEPGRRRTTLLFVFRDRTRTPLEMLVATWEADLARLWDALPKPPGYEASALADFFELRYAALPNFEDRPDEFAEAAAALRARFAAPAAADGAGDAGHEGGFLRPPAEGRLPGAALALSMAKAWDAIQHQRDLDLPAHRVMVANIRCAELAAAAAEGFAGDAGWAALAARAGDARVPGFGAATGALMDAALAAYDAEARYFDAGVAARARAELEAALEAAARPAFDAQLGLAAAAAAAGAAAALAAPPAEGARFADLADRAAAEALAAYDAAAADAEVPGTHWSTMPAREALRRDVAAAAAAARAERVAAARAAAEAAAAASAAAGAAPLLEDAPRDLWPRLAAVAARAAAGAAADAAPALAAYEPDAAEAAALDAAVAAAARGRVLAHAREAANTALARVKDRFRDAFGRDEAGLPRAWTPSADVAGAAAGARRAAARLLAQLCVARLDGAPAAKGGDAVEAAVLALAERGGAGGAGAVEPAPAPAGGFDLLSAAEWPASVPPADVLLPPAAARAVWRGVAADAAFAVQQALATQEANRLAASRPAPLWAVAAIAVLGANEALAVLRNPLLLAFLVLLFLFAKTVYVELGVEEEMRRGLLPGAVALGGKFVPTVRAVAARSAESVREFLRDPQAQPHAAGGGGAAADGVRMPGRGAGGGDALRSRRREAGPGNGGGGAQMAEQLSRKDE